MTPLLIKLFFFYVAYAFVWLLLVASEYLPSPIRGGEEILSLYFILFASIPNALAIIALRKNLSRQVSSALGVIAILGVIPITELTKVFLSLFGSNSFAMFFIVFAVAQFAVAVFIVRLLSAIRRSRNE